MTKEEALDLLKNDQYEEAYKYFLEQYNKTKSLYDKYYVSIIEFHHMDVPSDKLYNDFKQLLKLPHQFRSGVLSPLVFLCAELNKNKEVIKYARKAIENGDENPFFRVALAKALVVGKNNRKEIMRLVDEALSTESINLELIAICLEIKVIVYLEEKNTDDALKSVNQMYLKYGKHDFIDYMKLDVLENMENTENEIEETYESLLNGENRNKALAHIFDYYYKKNNHLKVLEYADIILHEELSEKGKNMALARKGMAYQALKQFDFAIECFMQMTDNEKYLHLGELYYDKGFKEGVLEAIKYFTKYLEINVNTIVLGYLVECYSELGYLDKMYEYISLVKKNEKKFIYISYWLIDYYRRKGLFNKAKKYIRKSYKEKTITAYQFNFFGMMVSKKPYKYYRFLSQINLGMENNAYFDRKCASMFMHGEYGMDIDREKALKKAMEAIELENCACSKSILANYYLNENEEYSKAGYEDYINRKDTCPCAAGFYAYKLFVNDEKEKAFELLDMLVMENGIKVSENIANLYAYTSLVLHKDINKAYEFLKNFKERRYQISSTFVLILIEKELGIDTKKRIKEMNECLKYCSKAEFEYYSKEPVLPFMNNF